METRPGIVLPALIVTLLLLVSSAWSAPKDGEQTIFIGHLNFDPYQDTVRGEKAGEDGYLPSRILWGARKGAKQTKFVYPGWKITAGSVAFQSVNGDSLTDIIIHIRGKSLGDSSEIFRSICLFGQHDIHAVPVIRVSEIRRFQAKPFFAMHLVRGNELTQPGTRDLSGTTSYILEPIDINLGDRDSLPPPTAPLASIEQAATGNRQATVRVYPNPTGNTLSIEAAGLAPSAYILQVISVNGDVEIREEVTVRAGEGLQKTLDLARFASGYYVVRIESGEGVVGTWPIIITH